MTLQNLNLDLLHRVLRTITKESTYKRKRLKKIKRRIYFQDVATVIQKVVLEG